ncbi:MAG: hypothetical protein EIB84_03165 [Spiroplasma poulsonii]|uniref:Single-stranded DNA-binding protein n=1 Tax=Spiroplasma poulsonii TaxID=2138 RepID=A0A2P6FEA5_9MOLU|nr:hypothetical protein [Spiroplasma poulsonii]KAF0850781.1 hypothetical protein MSROBK_016730 [Spiroplasma poulsonii]MBW1241863.1 hypothetical protein [Spiroplasma poulsonii]PQM31791.1 hypothetical protein SMSRO_SF016440 [Spiroplasma poulsonii]PWF96824.1 hypothetical protein SMSE_22710 [Spiroplasma poulsonii]PWF97398.1 hypothetical protein SMH99_22070 [Spiroplasma poulsonii]
MQQIKNNLSKTSVTNKTKIKNKKINKLELTVRLHENPIKTKIKALVAGGVEVDACSAKCQWDGLNYSTLSIYNPYILTEFLKLKKDDEIKIKGSVFNQLNIKTKRYFLSFRVDSFEIIKKAIRKRTNTNIKN